MLKKVYRIINSSKVELTMNNDTIYLPEKCSVEVNPDLAVVGKDSSGVNYNKLGIPVNIANKIMVNPAVIAHYPVVLSPAEYTDSSVIPKHYADLIFTVAVNLDSECKINLLNPANHEFAYHLLSSLISMYLSLFF